MSYQVELLKLLKRKYIKLNIIFLKHVTIKQIRINLKYKK